MGACHHKKNIRQNDVANIEKQRISDPTLSRTSVARPSVSYFDVIDGNVVERKSEIEVSSSRKSGRRPPRISLAKNTSSMQSLTGDKTVPEMENIETSIVSLDNRPGIMSGELQHPSLQSSVSFFDVVDGKVVTRRSETDIMTPVACAHTPRGMMSSSNTKLTTGWESDWDDFTEPPKLSNLCKESDSSNHVKYFDIVGGEIARKKSEIDKADPVVCVSTPTGLQSSRARTLNWDFRDRGRKASILERGASHQLRRNSIGLSTHLTRTTSRSPLTMRKANSTSFLHEESHLRLEGESRELSRFSRCESGYTNSYFHQDTEPSRTAITRTPSSGSFNFEYRNYSNSSDISLIVDGNVTPRLRMANAPSNPEFDPSKTMSPQHTGSGISVSNKEAANQNYTGLSDISISSSLGHIQIIGLQELEKTIEMKKSASRSCRSDQSFRFSRGPSANIFDGGRSRSVSAEKPMSKLTSAITKSQTSDPEKSDISIVPFSSTLISSTASVTMNTRKSLDSRSKSSSKDHTYPGCQNIVSELSVKNSRSVRASKKGTPYEVELPTLPYRRGKLKKASSYPVPTKEIVPYRISIQNNLSRSSSAKTSSKRSTARHSFFENCSSPRDLDVHEYVQRASSAEFQEFQSSSYAVTVDENSGGVRMSAFIQPIAVNSCDSECKICNVEFDLDSITTVLPCSHEFHVKCLIPKLRRKAECPTCRQSVKHYE